MSSRAIERERQNLIDKYNAHVGGVDGITQEERADLQNIDLKADLDSPTFTGDVRMPGTGIWNSSGNVGIGTTAPGEKLEVVGNIISKGTSWTIRTSAANNNWYSVTYGNGLFVAVASTGTGNRVMTSPDGINWTIRTSVADNCWYSVTYGNGLFVAVAYTGTGNRVMTSGKQDLLAFSHNNIYQGGLLVMGDVTVGGVLTPSGGIVGLENVENTVHSTDAHTMTLDGRDVSVDGTKLDGIEASAVALATVIPQIMARSLFR